MALDFRHHVLNIKPCIWNAYSDIQHYKVQKRKTNTTSGMKGRKMCPQPPRNDPKPVIILSYLSLKK